MLSKCNNCHLMHEIFKKTLKSALIEVLHINSWEMSHKQSPVISTNSKYYDTLQPIAMFVTWFLSRVFKFYLGNSPIIYSDKPIRH